MCRSRCKGVSFGNIYTNPLQHRQWPWSHTSCLIKPAEERDGIDWGDVPRRLESDGSLVEGGDRCPETSRIKRPSWPEKGRLGLDVIPKKFRSRHAKDGMSLAESSFPNGKL